MPTRTLQELRASLNFPPGGRGDIPYDDLFRGILEHLMELNRYAVEEIVNVRTRVSRLEEPTDVVTLSDGSGDSHDVGGVPVEEQLAAYLESKTTLPYPTTTAKLALNFLNQKGLLK